MWIVVVLTSDDVQVIECNDSKEVDAELKKAIDKPYEKIWVALPQVVYPEEKQGKPETEYDQPHKRILIREEPTRRDRSGGVRYTIDSIPISFATNENGVHTVFAENGWIYDWFPEEKTFKKRKREHWVRLGRNGSWTIIRE